MGDDFSSDTFEDRELQEAKLRRRKIHENATPEKKARLPILTILLAVIIFFFVGSVGYALVMPEKVVNEWPEAAAYYEKIGIFVYPQNSAPRPSVEIKPYASSMVVEGDINKLTVSGHIINTGKHSVVIPQIIGTLLDISGNEIYTWVFCLPNRTLVRGQGVDYEYIIKAAPGATATAVIEIKWEKDADGEVIDTCAGFN